jgi:hypothetical protein
MKLHYTFDDSAARLPLTIRGVDGVWDRVSEFRNGPGIQLVEQTTQYMLNTGATLIDELAYYFDHEQATESDPYSLMECYAEHRQLENLWSLLTAADLVGLEEIEALFPESFERELNFTLALTAVGVQAFGYVRTYKDDEEDEYHGLVVNLTQARPHLEEQLGEFSRSLLVDMIRHGFFNHEAFLLAYGEYCEGTGRVSDRLSERFKHVLLSRGIAWYLSYRHDLAYFDGVFGPSEAGCADQVERVNHVLADARNKRVLDDMADDEASAELRRTRDLCLDQVGYHVARTIAEVHGDDGLRAAIAQGPDHFIALYNAANANQSDVPQLNPSGV